MRRLHKNNRGFTLLEILVAMTVFSVGLLGMAALTVGIIRGNLSSNNLTTASTLAQDRMENIIRAGYASASDLTENYGGITNYPLYKRVTVINNNSPAADMKTVTITVYWDSDSRSVVLKTILTR